MSLTIRPCDPDDAYASTITSFLAREFPANLEDKSQVLEALTAAFIASGQIRQGPAPSPESQVAIRQVIKYWMDKGEPIAVLSPWGSKKPRNDMSVDVAELMAMRQLMSLRDRVKKFYEPGIIVDLGIEDMGGWYLWPDKESRSASIRYVENFVTLVNVLDEPWLMPVVESELVTYHEFKTAADMMYEPLIDHLMFGRVVETRANSALRKMHELGWNGNVPEVQIEFYMRQYDRYYPELDHDQKFEMLGRYLSQSWARYHVNAKLKYPTWGPMYVQINFPQTVPGIPTSLGDRRLYYRTLPMKFAKTHLPAWRAQGYLAITNKEVVPKLKTVFESVELHKLNVELTNGRDTVVVASDYEVRG